jgi:methylenetetrahydrofolate dehydrogenase (NADP+)/methenyltetrahydrofolate cyclohydrolase
VGVINVNLVANPTFYSPETTSPLVLSGREAGAELLARVRGRVDELRAQGKRPPGLVVVQVGADPASSTYIRQKEKAALGCGFVFRHAHLSREDDFETLHRRISQEASDPAIDGIIIQLPMDSAKVRDPERIRKLLALVPPEKDADGLDTLNQGRLFAGESTATGPHTIYPIPATALGVVRLLQHFGVPVEGRECVVVGRSRLVGAPVGALLLSLGATVTTCHSRTRDLAAHTRRAELLVVCAGKRHLITPDHVRPGAVIVDVGMHVKDDGKLTGDVHPDAFTRASAYSPVPGGVGPMTVAGLMENTLNLRLGAQ